jgi:hypothetical protein
MGQIVTARRLSVARAAALALVLGLCGLVAAATVMGTPLVRESEPAVAAAAPQVDPPAADPAGQPGVSTDLPQPPGTTSRVSVADNEAQASGASGGASTILPAAKPNQAISADGRWVAFVSADSDLIPGESHRPGGLYLRDRELGTTIAIPSVGGGPFPANISAAEPVISADGGVVAFTAVVSGSFVGGIAAPATAPYVFAWDRSTNATTIVSVDDNQRPIPGWQPSISADGRYVAYTALALPDRTPPTLSNLTANPTNITPPDCSPRTTSTISVTATDSESAVSSVTLFYTPSGGSTASKPMSPVGSNGWQATITFTPGWGEGQVTYWVQGTDSNGNTSGALFPTSANVLTVSFCIL